MKRSGPIERKPSRKRRPAGIYCTIVTKRRCPRKRYEGQALCAIHYADQLARDFVKARDGACVRCGATEGLQWAHIIGRSYKLVRWNPLNAVTFCASCHLWQTHHPLEGEEFFRQQIGADSYDALRFHALRDAKPDPEFWIARYEAGAA